ncbi:hypothetical protein [Saccharopolyspora sp. NPDC050642]|uniref:hypothetical protein n=1 Tax=Saccharopolyspora sp. NPDC050642 TaxID=3157099 RepID=UPI0033F7BA29
MSAAGGPWFSKGHTGHTGGYDQGDRSDLDSQTVDNGAIGGSDGGGAASAGVPDAPEHRHTDTAPHSSNAPQVETSIEIDDMSGGTVIGSYFENRGLLPLDDVAIRRGRLERLLETYAEPAGFETLRARVEQEQRIVVFDLDENAGRTTHAEVLAAHLAGLAPRRAGYETIVETAPPAVQPSPYGPFLGASGPSQTDIDAGTAGTVPHRETTPGETTSKASDPFAPGGDEPSGPREPREGAFDVAWLKFGGSPHFPDKRLPLDRRRIWLLEIPIDEDGYRVSDSFGDCLPELDRLLGNQNSRLFVLTRPEQWRRIGAHQPRHWVSARDLLEEVAPLQVARAHLVGRMPGIDIEGWLGNTDIAEAFSCSSMNGVVDLVEAVLAAEETPPEWLPSESADGAPDARTLLARRISMVLDSRGQWRRQLLAWHREQGRTAFERDFQVTAAAMDGLPVAHVYYGAVGLNNLFAGSSGTSNSDGQEAPGVIQMLDVIGGELRPDDRINFPRPGWADAILEYFWLDRPLSRNKFIEWLASAPDFRTREAMESVTDEQRRVVARRIVRFALRWAARQKRDAPLEKLAQAWRGKQGQRYLWDELVDVVSAVASAREADPGEVGEDIAPLVKHRAYVHKLLLNWARSADIGLAHAVLAVCAGPFADRYTSKTLVRLKHAGRHLDEQTQPVLEQVIAQLWQESSARTTLMAEIAQWCNSEEHRKAGCVAFAQLAVADAPSTGDVGRGDESQGTQPPDTAETSAGQCGGELTLLSRVADYGPNHRVLSQCWRAYLTESEQPASTELVTVWLNTAVTLASQRRDVLEVLRGAVRGSSALDRSTRDVVRGIARTWAEGSSERGALYQELTAELDADVADTMQILRSRSTAENSEETSS